MYIKKRRNITDESGKGKNSKKNDTPEVQQQKKILIPLDEHGEPYGWGLLIGKFLISQGIPVGSYRIRN